MKNTSFAVKASLIASLILSGVASAQNLPDEINHTQYLQIYQNLSKVLEQKTIEFNNLSAQKADLEKQIAEMEKDQRELPARNAELQKLIDAKKQDIARLDSEIQGLEGVLARVIEDLRRSDNIIAQLQRDLSQESQNGAQIQARRNQIAQDVAQITARLQGYVNQENQVQQNVNRIAGEMNASIQRKQEVEQERNQLARDVEMFKVQIVKDRQTISTNQAAIPTKKSQMAEAQGKVDAAKAELAVAEPQLAQIDASIGPKRTQLNALKAELERLSPNITRLKAENKTLSDKIAANDAKIKANNVDGLISQRDALSKDIEGTKTKMDENTNKIIAINEAMKPVLAQINDIMVAYRQAIANRNMPEAARLKKQADDLNASIDPQRREAMRLQKENDNLAVTIAPKQNQINALNTSIANAQSQNSALQADSDNARAKIAQNDAQIAQETQANAGLAKQIADLDAEIKVLEAQRAPLAQKIATLKQQQTQSAAQVADLAADIKRLEEEVATLTARIPQMEKAINEFPQNMQRLQAHIRQLEQKIPELRRDLDRENMNLNRVRQDRLAVQGERDRAAQALDIANRDLESSQRLAGAINQKLQEEVRNREAIARYNQDSVAKLDRAKAAKAQNEKDIAGASQEIDVNSQDIQTISQQLPKLKSDLNVLSPKVASAENARNQAQRNADDANSQYQNRLSLYQNYLAQAQALGEEKASIGTQDGTKTGAVDAKTKAAKIAAENASSEAKWEALKRGYVRGEIAGFNNGFDIGMSSAPDAQRGEADGQIAGAKRAKDYANMVVKQERYLEELERRLKEDEVSSKPQMAMMIRQEVSNLKAMSMEMQATIPDLTDAEIAESSRIISALDTLIAQADVELKDILNLRQKLQDARNVYSAPAAGENQNNANCSGVYKGVKDYVEACKGSYVIRYQKLYTAAHSDSFLKTYTGAFNEQIDRVFDAELSRLYPGYLKEATSVGKEVGIATGKKEIYQQSFARAENAAYAGTLPAETARVETEAVNLVQEHLNNNAALTLKGSAKIVTSNEYGIAPGAEAELKMLIKNIGKQASIGNSLVRVTSITQNVTSDRKEAPLASVAAQTQADLSVLKLKVSDAALPGSQLVIAGEIVHPGNHYRSNRVESFRIETLLKINPSIDNLNLDFDSTPDIAGLFGTKKHDVEMVVKPLFAGVDQGYEVTLEEVGTNFMEIVSRPAITEVLNRGVAKKVKFTYKLQKAAKGRALTLKLTVKNNGKVVSSQDLKINPK